MLIDPCPCSRSRKTAMLCPRERRGSLMWEPANGQQVGPMVVVDLNRNRETLTFGTEWEHCSEGLARDHARVRHLDFAMA